MIDITVSIVLYNSDPEEINNLVRILSNSELKIFIYLIDNSPTDKIKNLLISNNLIEYIFNNKNIGYGAGHNVAIRKSLQNSKYHLVLNPDVEFDPGILKTAVTFLDNHSEVGMLSPKILYYNGEQQYMCRMLPTPFDLIFRRFIPDVIKKPFSKKLNQYLMMNIDFDCQYNIPNLPGSFMLIRNKALQEVGLFDERFFMYLEDVDLTRRLNAHFLTLYFPSLVILHKLEQGSYKSKHLLKIHMQSAISYFNKWGWFFDSKRKKINRHLLKY